MAAAFLAGAFLATVFLVAVLVVFLAVVRVATFFTTGADAAPADFFVACGRTLP